MARNPKLDLAKRQAVGIYRPASRNAALNGGEETYSGGDYRTPDAAKLCYLTAIDTTAQDQAAIALYLAGNGRVKQFKTGLDSSGRIHKGDFFRSKGAGCDPRTRRELVPGQAVRGLGLCDPTGTVNPYPKGR